MTHQTYVSNYNLNIFYRRFWCYRNNLWDQQSFEYLFTYIISLQNLKYIISFIAISKTLICHNFLLVSRRTYTYYILPELDTNTVRCSDFWLEQVCSINLTMLFSVSVIINLHNKYSRSGIIYVYRKFGRNYY